MSTDGELKKRADIERKDEDVIQSEEVKTNQRPNKAETWLRLCRVAVALRMYF